MEQIQVCFDLVSNAGTPNLNRYLAPVTPQHPPVHLGKGGRRQWLPVKLGKDTVQTVAKFCFNAANNGVGMLQGSIIL